MTSDKHILKYENVTVRQGDMAVLDDFNLAIKPQEKVILTGPSGVGKTTVLRLPLGFRRPDAGRVLFDGEEIDGDTVWSVRRRIAYVSQDVALGHGTVREFVDRAFSYRANSERTPMIQKINEALERLKLPAAILGKDLADISGGEKQRVAIAVSILLERDVFLLDEITSALDRELKKHVLDLFLNEPQWTVLAISHDAPPDSGHARTIRMTG